MSDDMQEVIEVDDLEFDYPSEATLAREPRKCRRHDWFATLVNDRGSVSVEAIHAGETDYREGRACRRCPAIRDPIRARRGRNNRSRGNAIEREVGKRLGLRRVGQFGGPEDLSSEMFQAQVKSGGAFSERFWSWLKAVPARAGQIALLVVTDAPGPGHRRRGVVIVDIDDWADLHRQADEAIQPPDPYTEGLTR